MGHPPTVMAASARRLIAAAERHLEVWDLDRGDKIYRLPLDSDYAETVGISPDGEVAISVSKWSSLYEADRKLLKVWDLNQGTEMARLPLDLPIRVIRFAGNSRRAVSDSHGGLVRVFHVGDELRQHALAGHPVQVTQMAMAGDVAASAAIDGGIKFWEAATGREIVHVPGSARLFYDYHRIGRVALTADGRYGFWVYEHQIADVGAIERFVRVADLRAGKVTTLSSNWSKDEFIRNSFAAAMIHGRNWVLCPGSVRSWTLWDLETGREMLRVDDDIYSLETFTLSTDGRYLVLGRRASMLVRDLLTGRETTLQVAAQTRLVELIAGRGYVVGIHEDGSASARSLSNPRETVEITAPHETLRALVAGPEGRLMAHVKGPDGQRTLRLPDEVGVTLAGGCVLYSDSAVTPDGRYRVEIRDPGSLSVRDEARGQWVAHYAGEGLLTACAISPGGYVVAGELSGRMHFLKLEHPAQP